MFELSFALKINVRYGKVFLATYINEKIFGFEVNPDSGLTSERVEIGNRSQRRFPISQDVVNDVGRTVALEQENTTNWGLTDVLN